MAQESEYAPRSLIRKTWNNGEKKPYITRMITSTVKFTPFQHEKIERMVKTGIYTTKAECIRAAMNDLILKIYGVIDENESLL